MTIAEKQARLAEIDAEIDTATGEELTALEEEARGLLADIERETAQLQARQALRSQIAAGAGNPVPAMTPAQPTTEERAAADFRNTNRMTISADQSRAVMVAGGQLVQPTKTSGINDIPGAKVSSIIDLVTVENCVGMGSDRVAYVDTDMDEAGDQTEGQAAGNGEPTFNYVDIKPASHAVLTHISDQAKKQTNLQYQAKVQSQALLALRKKAAKVTTEALQESELVATLPAKVKGGMGVIDETTLRNLTLQYGDDESVLGGAMLFLHKNDLIAFGDVRGTNEKKAIYTITPDASNPNTGTISEGGVSVKYCLNSRLTPCAGTAQGAEAVKTMFYGTPSALKLDLFSDYEIKVSEDFAFDKRMDTIRGAVDLGAGVVVKNAFVALTIPATA